MKDTSKWYKEPMNRTDYFLSLLRLLLYFYIFYFDWSAPFLPSKWWHHYAIIFLYLIPMLWAHVLMYRRLRDMNNRGDYIIFPSALAFMTTVLFSAEAALFFVFCIAVFLCFPNGTTMLRLEDLIVKFFLLWLICILPLLALIIANLYDIYVLGESRDLPHFLNFISSILGHPFFLLATMLTILLIFWHSFFFPFL